MVLSIKGSIKENAMTEVINEYRNTIERLTNRITELEENKNNVEKMLDSIYVKDSYDDFVTFLEFLYKYKDDFYNFIKIKENNSKEISNLEIKDIEINDEYREEIKRLDDEKDNISINNNNDIVKLTEQINNLSKSLENSNNKIIEIQEVHKKELEKLNKKEVPLPSPSNSNENKSSQNVNTNKYSKYAKISVYDNVKNKWQEHIATDTIREIFDTIDLKNKIDNENSTLNDVQRWCMENPKNSSRTKKYYIKRKIEIVNEISKFKHKMKYIDFDLNSVARLNKQEYEYWKNDLLLVIDSIKIKTFDDNICSQNENIKNKSI